MRAISLPRRSGREFTATAGLIVFLLGAPALAAGDDRSAALAKAVQQMDRAAILQLLNPSTSSGSPQARSTGDQRIDVNAPQVDGTTALHWAAYHDDLELVKRLLSMGANVRVSNRYGITPLSIACTNGNVAMVDRLLGAGADPNTSLPGGESVLMTAARTGNVGVVRALIARGADVHAKDARGGQTAVMWAAAEGHDEVLEELIKAGADFRTPLASGFTPLLFAVREGRIAAVKALLKAGADVNSVVAVRVAPKLPAEQKPIRPGTTPLLLAVTNAHFELAAALLDAGADPNADELGYTALHALVKARNPGIGDNEPGPQGSGTMSSLELVKRLVARGADVNARMTRRPNLTNTRFNELGATPFLLAAVTADAELMRALVAVGADPSMTNEERSTALMAAAGLGTRSPGEDAGTEEEVLESVQLLLDLGADINAVDDHGETAMHGAAYKNLPRVVKFLAEKGARIDVWNTRNEFGWRPLTIARGYRFGNFKPSPVTVTALEEVMLAAGITPPTEKEEEAKGFDIYAPEPPTRLSPR